MYTETRKVIQRMIEQSIIPGASYAFIKDGKIEMHRDGLAATVPRKEKIQDNQQYDVASLTKVMLTTTTILNLLENKLIALEDLVHSHLPEFKSRKVTIRHLLTHTSALNGFIPNRDNLAANELKTALFTLVPDNTLGEKVQYADINMILLGYIIESIENETLFSVFEKKIIQPLNLNASTYHPINPMQCAPTQNHPQRGMIRGKVHDPKAYILGNHCGSAGLFSTLNDTVRFSQMMLQKGMLDGVRVLEEKTVFELLEDRTPNKKLNRSLGWDLLTRRDGKSLFHTGFTGTFIILNIKSQEAFIFLSNRVHPVSDTTTYLAERNHLIETYFLETTV